MFVSFIANTEFTLLLDMWMFVHSWCSELYLHLKTLSVWLSNINSRIQQFQINLVSLNVPEYACLKYSVPTFWISHSSIAEVPNAMQSPELLAQWHGFTFQKTESLSLTCHIQHHCVIISSDCYLNEHCFKLTLCCVIHSRYSCQ